MVGASAQDDLQKHFVLRAGRDGIKPKSITTTRALALLVNVQRTFLDCGLSFSLTDVNHENSISIKEVVWNNRTNISWDFQIVMDVLCCAMYILVVGWPIWKWVFLHGFALKPLAIPDNRHFLHNRKLRPRNFTLESA